MRRHLVLCSLLAACAADASSSLVRISDEPAGANCADGGVAIASGLDADDNGVLDDDEVSSTSYVCDGPSGDGAITTLVETAAEPAGANCAAGGTVVTIGPDTDGDGVLDADEVTSTVYVCDGVLVSTEDAGANCADGGTAVHTGVDDDGDGVLDPGEYDTTTYVCNGADGGGDIGTTIEGDYVINNSLDAALIVGVTHITGSLTISGSGMGTIALPALVDVGGDVISNGPSPQTLSLPTLVRVGGVVQISGLGTEEVEVPALEEAEVGVVLNGTALSASPFSSALTSTGFVTIANNPALATFRLDGVTTTGNVYIGENASLTTVSLDDLATTTQLQITTNATLTSVSLPALTTTTDLSIAHTAITSVSLPSLATAQNVYVSNNAVVTSVDLGALETTNDIGISANPILANLILTALADLTGTLSVGNTQLTTLALPALTTGSISIGSNPALATLSAPLLTSSASIGTSQNALAGLSLPALASAGNIAISQEPALAAVSLPALATVDGLVSFSYDPALTELTLPALTTAGGLYLKSNAILARVDLPNVTTLSLYNPIWLENNPLLGWLTMPALASIGDYFLVSNNPLLPTCHVEDIHDAVVANGWGGYYYVSGTLPCIPIDWCRLQSPLDASAAPAGALTYYGRYYANGFTTLSAANQASPLLAAAVGVGPDGTAPGASWTWTTAAANAGWDGDVAGEPNNDEWQATIAAPVVGAYDTAFRFSGDRGRTWTYCDRNAGAGSDGAEDGYQAANAGSLTVN